MKGHRTVNHCQDGGMVCSEGGTIGCTLHQTNHQQKEWSGVPRGGRAWNTSPTRKKPPTGKRYAGQSEPKSHAGENEGKVSKSHKKTVSTQEQRSDTRTKEWSRHVGWGGDKTINGGQLIWGEEGGMGWTKPIRKHGWEKKMEHRRNFFLS